MKLKMLLDAIIDAQTDVTYFIEQGTPGLASLARHDRDEAVADLTNRVSALIKAVKDVMEYVDTSSGEFDYLEQALAGLEIK